jgi:putative membrane protein
VRIGEFFSAADRTAIEAAVHDVEAHSVGEVVPYAVESSDPYARALWTASTLGALLAAGAAALVHERLVGWGGYTTLWIALPPLVGAALGWLATFTWPGLRRLLVPADVLEARVRQRARLAFLDEEVFGTRDRTGILIFISLLERRVVILADRGIADRPGPSSWDGIVAGIAAGIRRGEPGRALAEGIRQCGALLASRAPIRPDDRDELHGGLRLGGP